MTVCWACAQDMIGIDASIEQLVRSDLAEYIGAGYKIILAGECVCAQGLAARDDRFKQSRALLFLDIISPSGHSQGGAVCLQFLRKPRPSWLLGIVTSNSFLANQSLVYSSTRAAEYAHLPVYMTQGAHDTMIDFEWGRTTAERLEELGYAVNFVAFEGIDHDLSDVHLERLLHWIKEALPAVVAQDAYSPITFRVERESDSDRRARIVIRVPEGAEEQLSAMPVFACGGSFDLRPVSSGTLEVQVK